MINAENTNWATYLKGSDYKKSIIDLPSPKLNRMMMDGYLSVLRSVAYYNLKYKVHRDQELVSTFYEKEWGRTGDEFADYSDGRKEIYTADGNPVYADGWLLTRTYVEMIIKIIEAVGAESVLEVGAGRGKNLALIALKKQGVKMAGLELTEHGVAQSNELKENFPSRFMEIAGYTKLTPEQKKAVKDINFVQGSATEMEFPDKSFDLSYTILVLEQMPYLYHKVLPEMRRVTRKYCVFIEPFAEANNILTRSYLHGVDYFRYSYKKFAKFGLKPIYFTNNFPQKLRYKAGLLIAKVE